LSVHPCLVHSADQIKRNWMRGCDANAALFFQNDITGIYSSNSTGYRPWNNPFFTKQTGDYCLILNAILQAKYRRKFAYMRSQSIQDSMSIVGLQSNNGNIEGPFARACSMDIARAGCVIR
jgi:hypothetical protein